MTNEQPTLQSIYLDFIAADEQNPDPATVGEVGREIVKQLSRDGYTVQPVYTSEKGGEHYQIIIQALQTAWDHREAIGAAVGGFVGGAAILLGNIKKIIEAIEKIQDKLKNTHSDIENVTVQLKADGEEIIKGSPQAVSAYISNRQHAEALQKKELKLIASVPAKPKRRRRH